MSVVRGIKQFSPDARVELNKLKKRLEVWACEFLRIENRSFRGLPELHQYIQDDSIDEFQYAASRFVWDDGGLFNVAVKEIDFWMELFGSDLHVQAYPHLRIARPGRACDNVGFHRDTDYGASAYEVSVWIPFGDVPYGAGMWTFERADLEPSRPFEFLKRETGSAKGSKKNISGFPYKLNNIILTDTERRLMIHNSMQSGDYLLIPLASIHGSEINSSSVTRISVDMRLVPSHVVDEASTLDKRKTEPMGDGRGPYYRHLVRSSAGLLD